MAFRQDATSKRYEVSVYRESTSSRSVASFLQLLEYTDKISGAKAKRPGLDQLLADARRKKFDVVMVWAFDRMARSVRHFLEVLDELGERTRRTIVNRLSTRLHS